MSSGRPVESAPRDAAGPPDEGAHLSVEGLCAGYGSSVVLESIGFELLSGRSLALLGRNGVGKTTLITTLMGLTTRHAGSIRLGQRDLSAASTVARARAGLGWVPQERGVFPSLSVAEHLSAVARPGEWSPGRIFELFPSLAARSHHRGDQLSGGEQQMLAIGRALVTNPRVLLLDEPMEGLAPVIVELLARVIRELRDRARMSMILVEQHARLALDLTDEVLVLDRGRVAHRGPCAALRGDTALQERLLSVG